MGGVVGVRFSHPLPMGGTSVLPFWRYSDVLAIASLLTEKELTPGITSPMTNEEILMIVPFAPKLLMK